MYSVEDLLISHGYKLSRNVPAPKESYEGRQQARSRARAGPALLNGCEDRPKASPQSKKALGKGRVSETEKNSRILRVHGEPQGASASRTSEAGFYSQPVLVWTSQPQTGHEQVYWRKRGPEVHGVLGPQELEDVEIRKMAQAHSLPVHMREGPWEVGGRIENVMKKAVWEDELRMAGPAKWRDISLESWNQPRKLGRHMSDGDGEKLFQDLYPFVQGDQVLTSQSKGKSQSLPRVLVPESMSCMEIPIPLNDAHLPGVPKMPFYPPNCAPHLESTRNLEKDGSSAPFPRPKFGRPLKPPPYDAHQHSRGPVENSDSLDSLQTDPCASYMTKSSDPRQELFMSDYGLEPPMYVPPPSYRSPPQPITNPYLEEATPRLVSGGRGQQQHPMVKASASNQLPAVSLRTGNEYGVAPRSPHGVPPQPRPPTAYDGSVLYIPFDDPRIRHIKLAQPQGFCEETKLDDKLYDSGPVTPSEPAPGSLHPYGAVLNPQSRGAPSGSKRGPTSDPSSQWLWSQVPRGGENGGFPDQRDSFGVTRGQWPDMRGSQHGQVGGQAASLHPQSASTCETRTKLKKFETGLQTKKSSKKKTNETIFCLVSIPVKSESHLPEIDTNNNDLKQSADEKNGLDKSRALQEHSLLSMSSTDLELQALTGSMGGVTEFQKQGLGEPEEDKQTNDLSSIHPTQHRELKYSGSWPEHQYRDQQTQTSFSEGSKTSQPLPGAKLGGSPNTVLAAKFLDPAASEAQMMHLALASSDPKQRPNIHHLKGQMSLNLSSNSAFSRTPSSINHAPVSKSSQSQPCVDGRGPRASPGPKDEVVKGEPTGPCNSKQLFGQFLLKPVSRRPWDLISQLESFNKELQEEEESGDSSSVSSDEDSETEGLQEGHVHPIPRNLGFIENSQETRAEELPRMLVLEEPACRSERIKSKSESWSEEQKPGHPPSCHQPPGPWQMGSSRGESLLLAAGNLITEKGKEVEKRINQLAVSPGPVKRMTSSRLSDTRPVPQFDPAELRESREQQNAPGTLTSVEPSKALPLEADSGGARATVVAAPLSLADKPRGLSAPDLRSVGLTPEEEQSAARLDGPLGGASAVEIPPNESLQARAARILGIEVAVESLLPGARRQGQMMYSEPEESAGRLESPSEEPVSTPVQLDDPTVSTDAFYGRRKCGWTESPLFVGERDSARRAPQVSKHPGVDGAGPSRVSDLDSQPKPREPQSFNHEDAGTKPPFRSTLFHFIERTPSMTGSEKKFRSTSKVIESLQEKLASPPRRAAPDRLMRMKEINSVSRMRLLSSWSTDSTEEPEELKAERLQPGGLVSLSSGGLTWKVGHSPPLSKGTLSLEENGHLGAQREKNAEQDFWCPDSYDPSRVERV
ncbi:PREDICTED: junctional protein associated with coronary artery disease isoform X2 [Condylura cristata]|uniref:junctional protein associated with coronary artery disease isoform X2 n=1 Tax=Condylura cristata TaxID=143302 RepID=UPI0003345EAA|nr:PREDICTED: junctional protein associated with coronary artery disease isoform X2 [Condylura cristata]